ncbi:MAG: aldehyde dehydrogenase family protein, partial [Rhodocyclaceae bacterium]
MKPLYIDGAWVEGVDAQPDINPSDLSDTLGHYDWAGEAHTIDAVAAARAAFPAWRRSGIQQRADILDTIGTEILARKNELGDLLAREEGKPLVEAMGEVARAGQIFKFFAGEALRPGGELMPSVR